MSKATEQAAEIRKVAERLGVTVKGSGGIITVHKTFKPGDRDGFTEAEYDCNEVLARVPRTRPGSVWGTDGGSVGGAVGLRGGYMTLNKSGVGARLVAQFA